MSKFKGGIFSKASGKVSGLVFSSARAREGKVMTARQLVIPTNPQTVSQQSNRGIFGFCQQSVRSFGANFYRTIFNRGVQDLPGYQSLLSLIRRSYAQDASTVWRATQLNSDTLLGDLHFPSQVQVQELPDGVIGVLWDTDPGENGSANDVAYAFATQYLIDTLDSEQWDQQFGQGVRSDGSLQLEPNNVAFEEGVLLGLVFYSAGNPEGERRSICRWYQLVF